jgi:pilus assembly protein Flp/PilA
LLWIKGQVMAARHFRSDQHGMALTEYLVLLGLLVAGVVGGVSLFSDSAAGVWTRWADFMPTLSPATAADVAANAPEGTDDPLPPADPAPPEEAAARPDDTLDTEPVTTASASCANGYVRSGGMGCRRSR